MQGIGDFFGAIFGPIGQLFHYVFYLPVFNVLMVIYEALNTFFPAGAFALAIVILTLIIRSALIPLTRKQLQSTRKMQLIQPELKALQQRHRGDPQTLMAEQRRLYKENGVSMYGGCLPLLVQMPFLYALYGAFLTVIQHQGSVTYINNDLYSFVPHLTVFPQTGFFWANLVHPDPLHILPILAALLTFIQLRMAMPVRKPRQPGENPDPTMQATATTQYIMPLVTLFIGWTFPAGLALYWCISTAFSAVQQYFINGNWGSLFVGVPGMEHLVPPPKDLTPTVTRSPVTTGGGAAARALVAPSTAATPASEEGGLRGWWNRIKESVTAAQSQAMERAEQARKDLEESRAATRQQAAESERSGDKSAAGPSRRQRPSRQSPVLVKPSKPASGAESGGDEVDAVIQQATDQSVLPEQAIANGTNGKPANGKASSSSSGGSSASSGSKIAHGSNTARSGASGARSATTGGSNAARKNSSKGGSGGQSRGRSKRGR